MSTPATDEPRIEIEGEQLAVELTSGLISRMGYEATVASRVIAPAGEDDEASLWINVTCAEAERLLEYRAEGLDALQMLVQTMWGHRTKSRVRITVDLNGHRAEHQDNITRMAHRMAERVAQTGRAIMLEPMIASERRLIHIALRDDEQVFTESQGEGGTRRVVIKPKAPPPAP